MVPMRHKKWYHGVMKKLYATADSTYVKTSLTIFSTSLLNEPFSYLFFMLPFFLRKTLGASAFEIVLLSMLKPVVSIFSLYWSGSLFQRKDKLRSNLVTAGLLARVPFLLFPFFSHRWYVIFAAAMYMLFSRAAVPAWMEILKINLPKNSREKIFSLSSAMGYAEGMLIALGIGAALDVHARFWQILFFASALLGMINVLIQKRMPIRGENDAIPKEEPPASSFLEKCIAPWKTSLEIVKHRPDFAQFQWSFMACGLGLMILQPAIPLLFHDVLHLSYTDFAIARSICQGIGFILASPFWGKALNQKSFFSVTKSVCLGFALFTLLLCLSPFHLTTLYMAYFIYGVAQAGSQLIWHLSGPYFAKEEESSRYSGVNIACVGVRGIIGPPLGGVLLGLSGLFPLLAMAIGLSLAGYYFLLPKKSLSNQPTSP